jgi:class 3 adenylate cyclase/membrane protein implicated in regulation of membrane protease activity
MASTTQGVRLDAAQALAAHLREHPDAARQGAAKLAAEFGLTVEFVEDVLQGLRRPDRRTRERADLSGVSDLVLKVRLLFRRMTSKPTLFVAITTLLCVTLGFFLVNVVLPKADGLQIAANAWLPIIALLTILLHYACYFRHGMARYALYGGLAVWLIVAPVFMFIAWARAENMQQIGTASVLLLIAFVWFMLAGFYAAGGVLVAVGGNYVRMRRSETRQAKLSRQELLERFFRVKERLEKGERLQNEKVSILEWKLAEDYSRKPLLYATLLGFSYSFLSVLIVGLLTWNNPAERSPIIWTISGFLEMVEFVGLVAVGFFARGVGMALLACYAYQLGTKLPFLMPIGAFGPNHFLSTELSWTTLLFELVVATLVALTAAFASTVEARSAREQRLRENDPAALLAEMVRIQWRLSSGASEVCVVVVDAARSAEMKSQADPFAMEYSFREYQRLLETICVAHGGSIISTAGDGAVAAFSEPEAAFMAARRIQTEIDAFNAQVNRLAMPFKLRVGLHMGDVVGDLEKIEYTEVIDIAAHVQGVSPIGGIALTEAVASRLPEAPLIPLREPVDGQAVFLALDPKVDA